MENSWVFRGYRASPYKATQGTTPVYDFINTLDEKVKAKIIDTIDMLEEFGIRLGGLPHAKKLSGTPLWELHVVGSGNIRIFYITIVNKTFLLLHGFQKKKQKTDKKEIKTALKRLMEHQLRNKN